MLSDAPEHRLRMTDLAEQLKITRSRLTYAVTRLEKDGLLRREGCRWDKRGSVAVLTEAGMTVLRQTAPGHVETVRASLFDQLTAEQVGQLEEICTGIARAIQGRGDGKTCPAADDVPWRRRSSAFVTYTADPLASNLKHGVGSASRCASNLKHRYGPRTRRDRMPDFPAATPRSRVRVPLRFRDG